MAFSGNALYRSGHGRHSDDQKAAVKRRIMPYPCIGYCMIDRRGYCVGCGRPPTLGMPEMCAIKTANAEAPAPRASPAQNDTQPEKNGR